MKLATFLGIKWGIKPKQFRDICIKSIERTIVYAAPVYWKPTTNTQLLRKITSLQRIPLIEIVKAYKTVRNKSLNMVAEIKPIELHWPKKWQHSIFSRTKRLHNWPETIQKKNNKTQHLIEVWRLLHEASSELSPRGIYLPLFCTQM